eukprot:jgi/Astpho2/8758/Aster-x0822
MDVDMEGRAADLLDRLLDCGLATGVAEGDLSSDTGSPAVRSMSNELVSGLQTIAKVAAPADQQQFQAGLAAVKRCAASAGDAEKGRLTAALARVAKAVDPDTTQQDRLGVLEVLTGHLQAGRLLLAAERGLPAEAPAREAAEEPMAVNAGSDAAAMEGLSGDAAEMSAQIQALALALHLDNSIKGAAAMLKSINAQLDSLLPQLPPGFFQPILPEGSLSQPQVDSLGEINEALRAEYSLRRRMLIERAKVTLQSFMWAERLKERGTGNSAKQAAAAGEAKMALEPEVDVAAVFLARQSDLVPITSKATSGDKGQFEASVKSVIMGAVPDRGGRTTEGRAAKGGDMPDWKPRTVGQGEGSTVLCGA